MLKYLKNKKTAFYHIVKKYIKYKCYKLIGHIKLNTELYNKVVFVNPTNNDEKCFMWAILIGLHYNDIQKKHRSRLWAYAKYKNELNFTGIEFPVEIQQNNYERFKDLNPDIYLNKRTKLKFIHVLKI